MNFILSLIFLPSNQRLKRFGQDVLFCFVFIHTSVELLIWLAQAALVRNKSGFIKSTIISPSCFLSSFQLFPIPQANHFYFCVFNLDIHLCVCVCVGEFAWSLHAFMNSTLFPVSTVERDDTSPNQHNQQFLLSLQKFRLLPQMRGWWQF